MISSKKKKLQLAKVHISLEQKTLNQITSKIKDKKVKLVELQSKFQRAVDRFPIKAEFNDAIVNIRNLKVKNASIKAKLADMARKAYKINDIANRNESINLSILYSIFSIAIAQVPETQQDFEWEYIEPKNEAKKDEGLSKSLLINRVELFSEDKDYKFEKYSVSIMYRKEGIDKIETSFVALHMICMYITAISKIYEIFLPHAVLYDKEIMIVKDQLNYKLAYYDYDDITTDQIAVSLRCLYENIWMVYKYFVRSYKNEKQCSPYVFESLLLGIIEEIAKPLSVSE